MHGSWLRDFPGSPVVKILPSNARDVGLIPGWGDKIPHVSPPKHQKIKQKQYCGEFNKVFKNGPHQKKVSRVLERRHTDGQFTHEKMLNIPNH